MAYLSLAVLLPFFLASTFGLLTAYVLSRLAQPKQAFLLAIVVGLVGGAVGPGLLSASILTSDWFVASMSEHSWLSAWTTLSTFVLVPLLSLAVATLGTRALAYRRTRQVREG